MRPRRIRYLTARRVVIARVVEQHADVGVRRIQLPTLHAALCGDAERCRRARRDNRRHPPPHSPQRGGGGRGPAPPPRHPPPPPPPLPPVHAPSPHTAAVAGP